MQFIFVYNAADFCVFLPYRQLYPQPVWLADLGLFYYRLYNRQHYNFIHEGKGTKVAADRQKASASLNFVFEGEACQFRVLRKRFLSCIAALWNEEKANAGSGNGKLQPKG